MNALIAAAIAHKRVVLTALVMILLIGLNAYQAIPKEDNPEIKVPFFSVQVGLDGISPEDSERLIIRPLEKELKTLRGLKEMIAEGYEGGAFITLEFLIDMDPDKALNDVREKVDLARAELPDDADEPIIEEYLAADTPVLEIILSGAVPERSLVRIARDLKDRIEQIPTVAEVILSGEREEVMEVLVDPVKLETYDLSLSELVQIVQNNNRLVAAGALEDGSARFPVKLPGLIEGVSDVADLPVKATEDGILTLADLAEGRRTFKDATSLARFNGRPALRLEVKKRTRANTLQTAQAAKAVIAGANLPGSVIADISFDSSVYVIDFMSSLRNAVLSAVFLVAVVIVAALGPRSAGLVGVAIPGSFLFGILVLYFGGYTINVVVMFGLILAVGLLVDGAIVVTEYADRKMLEGLHRQQAFRLAAQRMAWPIIASTLTTLAAFLPLLFWPGLMGEFMQYIPLTLIFTLTGSLLMALIFLPTVGSLVGRPGESDANVMESLAGDRRFDPNTLTGLTGRYARGLAWCVRRPLLVMAGTAGVLVLSYGLFAIGNAGMKLFPDVPGDAGQVVIHARGNLSTLEKDRLVRRVEDRLQNINGVKHVSTRVGDGQAADTIGSIRLIYEDWHIRRDTRLIEAEIRERIQDVPGVVVEYQAQENGPVQGKDIQVQVKSDIPSLVEPAAARLRAYFDTVDGLVDVDDGLPVPGIEWKLAYDRSEAGRFGTDVATVGSVVQLVTNGALVGTYRPDDAEDELDIRVRLPQEARGLDALDRLRVPTEFGQVPLSNFLKRVPEPQVSKIKRADGARMVAVNANVADGALPPELVADIRGWIAAQGFDPRLSFAFKGQDELEQESTAFLSQAFIAAVFLMGLILLTQFNSFYNAFLILFAVLLSTVGVVFGLWLTGRPFVLVMSGIGIISLAGIVVNNNIVLIDTYARLVKSGMAPIEAIVRTGAQRLRPVCLTTITTIIGLLPMIFKLNIDLFGRTVETGSPTSFFWVDLAIAIAFGLSFATVLTLFVTPSLLALRIKVRRWRGKEPATTPDEAPMPLPQAAE
ncbi:MAG: efflux RND transporter permease subunit [Rhodothalassiaceae bacterium]